MPHSANPNLSFFSLRRQWLKAIMVQKETMGDVSISQFSAHMKEILSDADDLKNNMDDERLDKIIQMACANLKEN